MSHMTTESAVMLVMAELMRAESIHPVWPYDPVRAAALVAEESGELVKAVLDADEGKAGDAQIVEEAVQTAAAAIRFLKNHWTKEAPDGKQAPRQN